MSEQSIRFDMLNGVDARIHDPAALEEIELYAELMIVAAASGSALTADQIDRVLGVDGTAGSAVAEEHVDVPLAEAE
jgi:hypothetical protein